MRNSKFIKRFAAALMTAAMCFHSIPVLSAQAFTEQKLVGYRGDINMDMQVDSVDVHYLSDFLIGNNSHENVLTADLDDNGILNAADLTLLKRVALGLAEPEGIYEEQEVPDPFEETISAPIQAISPTLPCQGTQHLLVVILDFYDIDFSEPLTPEKFKEISFGDEDPSNSAYPAESVRAYYERASYGTLTLDVDVYTYTAKKSSYDYRYVWPNGAVYPDANVLGDEILSALDSTVDFSKYDGNGDGLIDSILVTVPDTASDENWWPASHTYTNGNRYDHVTPRNIIIGNADPRNLAEYNNTWIHELGHAMGLPDYYKYENAEDGFSGLNGPAGIEMMDDACGDMSAFSKLMYGWYTPSQIHVYEGGTQTYTLKSSQTEGNCIIIPRGDLNGYLSEFMILEYATLEGNNNAWWYFGRQTSGGLRVLHCEGSVEPDYWGGQFKWNNYSSSYDNSNTKQRVLRLVNEKEGGQFFTNGQVIDGNISGFHWYDYSGYQTVDTGVSVVVDSMSDGKMTVTLSQT